ncbi:MAG: M20/M25/M40 family metallo-hydrolase [Blastocatellia bacterium]|nr:M20/M25/M40 family metallo-hydrolase [Blastocatellia bacterium]
MTALLFLAVLIWVALAHTAPPAAVPDTAPVTEFSSARAMKHLRTIAREPHPLGSAAHAQVREYLVEQLKALGCEVEVQTATGLEPRRWVAGTVRNLVARIPGTATTKTLMLAAHYDSVPTAPGAGDDGAGVVAILETIRALKTGPPLRNDVLVLLTDGEEVGLLGAEAFVAEHRRAHEVGLVLNFEARGSCGPSLMFETSLENGRLIADLARVAPFPAASSLMFEAYRRLPNDTDVTIFKRTGMAALNFAFSEGHTEYHMALDRPEVLDEGSLQHHGSYALALARHFGNADLTNLRAPDRVYFDVPGLGLIHYPQPVAIGLTLVTVLLFLSVCWMAMQRRRASLGGLAWGFFTFPVSLAAAAGAHGLWQVALWLHPQYAATPFQDPANRNWYLAAGCALAVGWTGFLFVGLRRKANWLSLTLGNAVWWVLVLVAVTFWIPGGSFLFLWPLAGGLLLVAGLLTVPEETVSSAFACATVCAGLVPLVLLVVPTVRLLYVSLTANLIAAPIGLLVFGLGLCLPVYDMVAEVRGWLLPGVATLVCLVCVLGGGLTSGFDARHRRVNAILYTLNADTGQAQWVSPDPLPPDVFTSQFFANPPVKTPLAEFNPRRSLTFQAGPAPVVPLAAPVVQVLEDSSTGGQRHLRLKVASQRGALMMQVVLPASVTECKVNSRTLPFTSSSLTASGVYELRYAAPSPEGIELYLTTPGGQPVAVTVLDRTFELPSVPGMTMRPRPDWMMPWFVDSAVVRKTFQL